MDKDINEVAKAQIEAIRKSSLRIKPLVVIRCITYNHEPYIRDALEGFVSQKTNFPFVAIVHDDASTDGTVQIIREYAEKYPDIIKPIFEKENQYSKGNGSLGRIMNEGSEATGGEYVAMCEGDDYWTDPFKLQKQVDFLESHPDHSMCFHAVDILHQDTSEVEMRGNRIQDRSYAPDEVLMNWVIPTCSVVMRFECILNIPHHKDFFVGDNVLWATCLSLGKVMGMHECMGVYRRVGLGWTARVTKSRTARYNSYLKWIKHYRAMITSFPKIDASIFERRIIENMASASSIELLSLKKTFLSNFRNYKKEYGQAYVVQLKSSVSTIIKNKLKSFIPSQKH